MAPPRRPSLISSSGHANTARIFPVCRRTCWRLVPRKALSLRQVTPTRPGFSQPTGALVGALFPAKPYLSVEPRQHSAPNPDLPPHLLAPCSPPGLISPSGHANTARIFPACQRTCLRLVPCQALSLRPATPTGRPESRLAGALVGADPPAKPYLSVRPRQHDPET